MYDNWIKYIIIIIIIIIIPPSIHYTPTLLYS